MKSPEYQTNPRHKEKTPVNQRLTEVFCDRARIRTWDRLLRRQMLYPAELRDLLWKRLQI